MPKRNSHRKESTPTAVPLRRSPRFLQIVAVGPDDPKTPHPEQGRRTRVPSSATPLTLTGRGRRSHRSKAKECDESCNALQISGDSIKTRSKSTKLNRCDRRNSLVFKSNVHQVFVAVDPDDPKTPHPEQGRRTRVPSSATPLTLTGRGRRSHRSKVKECDESCNALQISGDSTKTRSKSTKLNGCDRRNSQWITEDDAKGKSLKNKLKHITRSQDNNFDQYDKLEVDNNTNEGVLLITEKEHLDEELSKKDVDKRTAIVVHQGPINVSNKISKIVGVKRTRNQFENNTGTSGGWTNDQELALERAYLEAKPTPHFWKKVSRLVPGKSAQECFDKVHGKYLTPPQPRLRSKPRVSNLQNPSFSASKLINFSSSKTKKPKFRKQKSHVIQRTVRHMLQNQYKPEQDSEADLFSVLEPTFSPLNCHMILTTPDRNPDEINKRFHEKSFSRFSNSYGKTLVSPPVLKQVKNKVLHEKYIDQLNCREANRKAEKVNQRKLMKQDKSVEKKDAIKAAKNALFFGARDAINEFQYQQATGLSNLFEEECGGDADEDNG